MTDSWDGTDYDEHVEESPEPIDHSVLVRHLRAELKEKNQRLAEAALVTKELAFIRAGVDTSTKLGQLLFQSYQGPADVETIRAWGLGVLDPPTEAT